MNASEIRSWKWHSNAFMNEVGDAAPCRISPVGFGAPPPEPDGHLSAYPALRLPKLRFGCCYNSMGIGQGIFGGCAALRAPTRFHPLGLSTFGRGASQSLLSPHHIGSFCPLLCHLSFFQYNFRTSYSVSHTFPQIILSSRLSHFAVWTAFPPSDYY